MNFVMHRLTSATIHPVVSEICKKSCYVEAGLYIIKVELIIV